MSALESYAPYIDTLEIRFWSFAILGFLLIGLGGGLFIATIRKINRDDRKIRERN